MTFLEKPNAETAEHYLNDGNFMWNSGMFILSYQTLIHELHKHHRSYVKVIEDLLPIMTSTQYQDLIDSVKKRFEHFETLSSDVYPSVFWMERCWWI